MISLELWRAKIGLFNCSRPPSSSLFRNLYQQQQQSVAHGWFLAGGGSAGLFSSLCRSLLIRRALVLLLVAVISHLLLSAGDVEQNPGPIFGSHPPTLLELRVMKGADGRPLRIVETIAAHDYETFGMYLLQDENGEEVNLIMKNHIHDGVESVTKEILKKWLISDAPTRTYQHLIECLRESELGALAELIENTTIGQGSAQILKTAVKCEIEIKITKLLVSGAGATGKTSLIAMLIEKEPVTEHDSTFLSRPLRYAKFTADSSQAWKSLEDIHDLEKFLASWLNKVDATNEPEQTRQEGSAEQEASDSSSAEETSNKTETHRKIISLMNKVAALDQEEIHFIYTIDSGGQPAFQDVLPAFIRGNSVAIHTLKLNEQLSDPVKFAFSIDGVLICPSKELCMTNFQLIETLVRSTSSHVSDNKGRVKPRCIIVGTHLDKDCSEKIKVKDDQLSKIPGIKQVLIEPGKDKVIFPVSTIVKGDDRTGFASKLRQMITGTHARTRGAIIKIEWFVFDLYLRGREEKKDQKDRHGIVSMDECKQIGNDYFHMTDEEVEKCIEHLHNQTLLLYFKKALPDVIFLEPHSILDKVSAILLVSYLHDNTSTSPKIADITRQLPPECSKNLRMCGLFNKEFLECIHVLSGTLKLKTTFIPIFKMENFLELLKDLFVIVELTDDEYFIPCVLPTNSALKELKTEFYQEIDSSRADALCVRWDEMPIPLGLFTALVVQLLQRMDNPKFKLHKNERCQYRNAIHLHCTSIDGHVLLVDSINWMEVHYTGDISNCCDIRQAIDEGIIAVREEFGYKEEFRHGFVCRQGAKKNQTHLCLVPTGEKKSTVTGYNNDKCTCKDSTDCSPQQYCWFKTTTAGTMREERNVEVDSQGSGDPVRPVTYKHYDKCTFQGPITVSDIKRGGTVKISGVENQQNHSVLEKSGPPACGVAQQMRNAVELQEVVTGNIPDGGMRAADNISSGNEIGPATQNHEQDHKNCCCCCL